MNLLTRKQSKDLDKISIEDFKIEPNILMENAGKLISIKSIELLSNINNPFILVVSGNGNNGGDALVAAKILDKKKYNVKIFTLLNQNRKNLSLKYYEQCISRNIPIIFDNDIDKIKTPDLIIDGLLGTGIKQKIRKETARIIKWINESNSIVLSIDVPSGLNIDSGIVDDVCVKASYTFTIEAQKLGMIFRDGKKYSGIVQTAKIGFPKKAFSAISGLNWKLFNERCVKNFLKKPKIDKNKYNSGKVLIIAGSRGMTGASILATYGALRSGAGMTISIVASSLNNIYEKTIIEGITLSLEDNDKGYLAIEHYDKIMEKVKWADSILLGPGLGRHKDTLKLIKKLIFSIKKPLVVDADGLFIFKNNYQELNNRKYPLIITPHFGELSNILGINKNELLYNFPDIMTNFMKNFYHVALVKQIPSCTFYGKNVIINTSGNPGLATAGSGDVLSGIIASFVAQGILINDATALAAFIHGKSSDIILNKKGYRGQIPSDLFNSIPEVIMGYEKS